jgi:hypothetical protein
LSMTRKNSSRTPRAALKRTITQTHTLF